MLVHYPVNKEAPFELSFAERVITTALNTRSEEDIAADISTFNPDVILCSGWSNKFYLKIVKQYRKSALSIVSFDNQWQGSMKQRLLRLMSPFWLRRLFKIVWVPGEPQKEYAMKLGYKSKRIFTGFYVADSEVFSKTGKQKLESKGPFPKTMISVARYIPQKDLPTLWKAFIAANAKQAYPWTLYCLGLGDLFDERIHHPSIHHLGFKQPGEMHEILLESGVYILPSLYEPWGVAVHEMAHAAMPMILSNKIGAGSMFLDRKNGYIFRAGNAGDLQKQIEQIMAASDETLWQMAADSYEKAQTLTTKDWADTLLKIKTICAE